MLKRLLVALAPFGVAMAVASVPAHAQADPLPSWIDGAAKARIVAFVKAATEPGGKDFVPPRTASRCSTTTARCGPSSRCTSSSRLRSTA